MRIRWDRERNDYRITLDKDDPDDCAPYLHGPRADPLELDALERFLHAMLHVEPTVTLRDRSRFAGALLRALGYLYGEDISANPDLPTLARHDMQRALRALRDLPTAGDPPPAGAVRLEELYGDL